MTEQVEVYLITGGPNLMDIMVSVNHGPGKLLRIPVELHISDGNKSWRITANIDGNRRLDREGRRWEMRGFSLQTNNMEDGLSSKPNKELNRKVFIAIYDVHVRTGTLKFTCESRF